MVMQHNATVPKRHPKLLDPDSLLREDQAAALLNFTQRTLQMWRRTGSGPPYIQASSRGVRYRRADLQEWIGARVRNTAGRREGDSRDNSHRARGG
jgi:predicted DNA-binding transcriptional regulator AlpA